MSTQNWSNVNEPNNIPSAKYITNEMLTPFTSNTTMPTSQIEMTISCRNLLNRDLLSKSDPYCIVSMKDTLYQDEYFEVGRTEMIIDTLNPEWVKKFVLDYNFETVQKMKFEVWDVDPAGQDFLGHFETTLADIVSYFGRQFVGNLTGISGRQLGQIVIVVEEVASSKQIAKIKFAAKNLTKLSLFSNNDPFLVISRSNEDGSSSVVFKTETCDRTQNPIWQPFTMRTTSLCNGDFDRNIKIDCYDYRRNGSHKLIGTAHTSLRSLHDNKATKTMNLYSQTKQSQGDSLTVSGVLEIAELEIIEEISFLDYIRHGTQVHFAVAIDFTFSNGEPTTPKSLHFINPKQPNNYEIALRSVGEIIQHYDRSQLFPAFGFGAKIPSTGIVSHQFPLNNNPSHPYCKNMEEILSHYVHRLREVQLCGPTNFAPVINNTISIASEYQDGKHYFVLLIITDGIISDVHQTKHAIVSASTLPISIIIVGVGDADFAKMDELDSDDVRLTVDGRYADRDIVQFVPLNKFLSKNGPFIKSQVDLAKAVLEEIPDQLTGFMRSRGFKPDMEATQMPVDAARLVPTAPML